VSLSFRYERLLGKPSIHENSSRLQLGGKTPAAENAEGPSRFFLGGPFESSC
jgi:hypothetical protein